MQKGSDVEFKSLLTEKEYNKLLEHFEANSKSDYQTNHYFDTKRFSLKALNASLRVRQREDFELTYKRKKGYNTDLKTVKITKEDFKELRDTGVVTHEEVALDVNNLIKEQKLVNFLSLSTLRHYVPYGSGILNIDKSEYVGITDYEIEFTGKSYHQGKADFIKIISDFGIQYKKSEKKIKRAFNALKNLDDED